MARILSVGPDREALAARNRSLTRFGHEMRGAASAKDALGIASSQQFDIVLICDCFSDDESMVIAEQLQARMPQAAVVRMADYGGAFTAADIEDVMRGAETRLKAA